MNGGAERVRLLQPTRRKTRLIGLIVRWLALYPMRDDENFLRIALQRGSSHARNTPAVGRGNRRDHAALTSSHIRIILRVSRPCSGPEFLLLSVIARSAALLNAIPFSII